METLSFSFLQKFPPVLDVPLVGPRKKPQIKFMANSSFKPFQPIKKLITQRFAAKISTAPEESIVQGTRKQSLPELIFKPLDDFICSFINDLPLPPIIDPKHVLSGNFSPVDELPPTACEVVEGSLPPCLDGAYIQNGPNPQFIPRGPYHIADGDGMLHSIKISQGKATFCSRFVKTYKYMVERDLGYPVFPNIFASFNNNLTASMGLNIARLLTGQIHPFINGLGTANTSLALFGGHLLAIIESDLPYSITMTSDGDIINSRIIIYMQL